jgi:hypothetical protein
MTVTVGGLLLRTPRKSEEAPRLKRESAKQELIHTKNDEKMENNGTTIAISAINTLNKRLY